MKNSILFEIIQSKFCYLTNKSISVLLNISITQVPKLVNTLKDKDYVTIQFIYKKYLQIIELHI